MENSYQFLLSQLAHNNLKGGVTDLGNYKEGFCYKLKSKTGVHWVLCAESMVNTYQTFKRYFILCNS